MKRALLILAMVCLLFPAGALAQEKEKKKHPSVEEALDAFTAAEKTDAVTEATPMSGYPRFDISGWAKISAAADWAHDDPPAGVDEFNGLSRLRAQALPALDADINKRWKARISARMWHDFAYDIQDEDDFSNDYLESMQDYARLWEVWVQGSLGAGLDVTFGRQVVVWGTSDDLRVVDVINPLDIREPFMNDIEELRIPVAMTRLDYAAGAWNVTALAVHEPEEDNTPAQGSPYDPLTRPLPPVDRPDAGLNDSEFGLAVTGRLTGWDVAFYFADFWENSPHLEMTAPATWTMTPGGPVITAPPRYEREFSRVKMLGSAVSVAVENWLFKGEAAYLWGLEHFSPPATFQQMTTLPSKESRERIDLLAGFDYNGFSETTISLEAAVRHLFDFDDALESGVPGVHENETEYALRVQRDFAYDTWHLLAVGTAYGDTGDDGWAFRAQAEHDYTDAVSFTLGGVL
ncbi:MAG: DUF1302 family protein, partial [Deltaproteobacteria bacterium]|nr:DUF1302 family protein [Deltaproteobacteria bacterium]